MSISAQDPDTEKAVCTSNDADGFFRSDSFGTAGSMAAAGTAALIHMAGMGAAGVTFLMIVVGAMYIGVKSKTASQIVGDCLVSDAGDSAEHLDACLCKCILCPCTDAAAENNIGTMLYEESDQCAVALTVGGNDGGVHDLTAFGLIELELSRMAKVLKDLTIFIGNCNFHIKLSF